jgi:hypothetical protein
MKENVMKRILLSLLIAVLAVPSVYAAGDDCQPGQRKDAKGKCIADVEPAQTAPAADTASKDGTSTTGGQPLGSAGMGSGAPS